MNEMLTGNELKQAMQVLPPYDPDIKNAPLVERLLKLDTIYDVYVPTQMATEIYSRLYLACSRSIQKKKSREAVAQQYENFKAMRNNKVGGGIIGGADSLSIVGCSGIGKSSAIARSIELIGQDDIVSCLVVQCPNDCRVKGLLTEILLRMDSVLGTDYYERTIKARPTIDMLISAVSNILIRHCAMLVIDEIQNVKLNMQRSNNGASFIAFIVQLINTTGISIVLVGTPKAEQVFSKEMHLARRTVGLSYSTLPYNKEFHDFCKVIWNYQYVKAAEAFNEAIAVWLYQHSGGLYSVVVGLIRDAQEISMLDGVDILNVEALEKAYRQRYQMLNQFVRTEKTSVKKAPKQKLVLPTTTQQTDNFSLYDTMMLCKKNKMDIIQQIQPYVEVLEVAI